MEKSIDLYCQGFESATRNTPEFNKFFRSFKKEFTEELQNANCKNIVFHKGHFYLSGFFTTIDGRIYYFFLSDVRDFNNFTMYVRTAKDYKDFTGGVNNRIDMFNVEKGFMSEFLY